MNHLSSSISWDDFKAAVEAWSPTDVNVADLRRMVEFLYFQGTRPMQRSDVFGAAFSALSLIEGIYTHVLNVARAECAAADAAAANEGAAGGAAERSGDVGGGGPRP